MSSANRPPSSTGPASKRKPSDKNDSSSSASDSFRSLEQLFGGASLSQLHHFCSRVGTGLHSGLDTVRILDVESKAGAARYRQAVKDSSDKIRAGYSLPEAMQLQGAFFPPLLIKMIEAGEHSGQIDRVLKYMSDYYLDLKRTRQDFISQITAPVIQLIAAIGIVCLLIFINGFFQSGSTQEKPFDLTGIGLRGAQGVMIFLGILSLIGALLAVLTIGIWKNWFNCHQTLVPLVRNVPVIGPVFTNTALARLSMTLSMMLGAGVDAKKSVRDSVLSTGNFYYISGLEQMMQMVEQGHSLSETLDAPKVLPDEFIQTVEVGEMSGNDSESLERMAVQYGEKARLSLKQLAVTAGFAIWFMIAAMIITVIFTIFLQYLAILNGNLPK
ncbi:MAG: type II secretion system F family protein [Planctomycetota bacterium]|jgi:type IV pilus assembly protein PilC